MKLTEIEIAMQKKRRAFYQRATQTLRLCPENYCLAYKPNGQWVVYRDEGSIKKLHDKIKAVLETWRDGSTGDALADEIGKLFKEQEGEK